MKKCLNCNKYFDDTWHVCLNCNGKLTFCDKKEQIEHVANSVDKKKTKINSFWIILMFLVSIFVLGISVFAKISAEKIWKEPIIHVSTPNQLYKVLSSNASGRRIEMSFKYPQEPILAESKLRKNNTTHYYYVIPEKDGGIRFSIVYDYMIFNPWRVLKDKSIGLSSGVVVPVDINTLRKITKNLDLESSPQIAKTMIKMQPIDGQCETNPVTALLIVLSSLASILLLVYLIFLKVRK